MPDRLLQNLSYWRLHGFICNGFPICFNLYHINTPNIAYHKATIIGPHRSPSIHANVPGHKKKQVFGFRPNGDFAVSFSLLPSNGAFFRILLIRLSTLLGKLPTGPNIQILRLTLISAKYTKLNACLSKNLSIIASIG